MVIPNKQRKLFKAIHLASTAWFAFSACYIIVLVLLQTGQRWWFIVSVSGYSVVFMFLLMNLYLFAIFRAVARSQKRKSEHPFTTSIYYSLLYDLSPFLGILAGILGAIGVSRFADYLLVIAAGSLLVTFLVWIIIDPIVGLVEMLLPTSRKHRYIRLEQARDMRKKELLAKKRLLAEVEIKDKLEKQQREKILLPYAEKLANLVCIESPLDKDAEQKAVDIGVQAWQIGGLNCMRQLNTMVTERIHQNNPDAQIPDFLSIWWDGIGSWRSYWLDGEMQVLEKKGIPCEV